LQRTSRRRIPAVRFTTAGLAFSYPEVTAESGAVSAEDTFDLALAIKSMADDKPVVVNDFRLDRRQRILVVTGPDQGGKTTSRELSDYAPTLHCPAARYLLDAPA
jgi:DNA mismatch repair protein MutS